MTDSPAPTPDRDRETIESDKARATVFIFDVAFLLAQGDLNPVEEAAAELIAEVRQAAIEHLTTPYPLDDWHDDDGPALWHRFPICEPPYVGGPTDGDWPGYHTHWTRIPMPNNPRGEGRGDGR